MSEVTNKLVAIMRKYIVSAGSLSALVIAGGLFLQQNKVHAAGIAAGALDDQSVSSLEALDKAVEAVASRVTPAVVNVAVTSRGSEEQMAQQQEQDQDGEGMPPGL